MKTLLCLSFLGLAGTTLHHYSPAPVPHLRVITVKILANQQPVGSGALLAHKNGRYQVITNDHVLRSHAQPWQIQTFDRQIYTAQVTTPVHWQGLDLALLSFTAADKIYAVAKVNTTAAPQVGEDVVAGGFPLQSHPELQPDVQGFVTTRGQVKYLLSKPLEEGYQIGYSNEIQKGMSGGPLLNSRQELVGINGIHGQPLWSSPELFADGTVVPEPLQSEIGNWSWAIPIRSIQLPTTDGFSAP